MFVIYTCICTVVKRGILLHKKKLQVFKDICAKNLNTYIHIKTCIMAFLLAQTGIKTFHLQIKGLTAAGDSLPENK